MKSQASFFLNFKFNYQYDIPQYVILNFIDLPFVSYIQKFLLDYSYLFLVIFVFFPCRGQRIDNLGQFHVFILKMQDCGGFVNRGQSNWHSWRWDPSK